MDVLDEAEARLAARRNMAAAGGPPAFIPKIVLARDEAGRALRCAYSPHCMRVTGLTALANTGVPFWIISKIVAGHCSFLMTLRYIKVAPGAVVSALKTLLQDMRTGALERVADEVSSWTEEARNARMVQGGPAATGNSNQTAGFWRASPDGIYPNGATLCHEGGPADEGRKTHGPVQGGAQNCALCRFFITGPRFIPGRVAWFEESLNGSVDLD